MENTSWHYKSPNKLQLEGSFKSVKMKKIFIKELIKAE